MWGNKIYITDYVLTQTYLPLPNTRTEETCISYGVTY